MNISRRKFLGNSLGALALGLGGSSLLGACCKSCKASPRYKLGVADWTLGNEYKGSPKAFDFGKEVGLDGIQLSSNFSKDGPYYTPENFAALKQKMAELSMQTASTSPQGMSFLNTEGSVDFTKKTIGAARELGANAILLAFFGKDRISDANNKLDEKFFAPLVSKLKELTPLAEKLDVNICLENTLTAEENIRVIEAVGSPKVKVYFDTMNIEYYGHDAVSSIKKLKNYIGEIHLKNIMHKLDAKDGSMPKDFLGCLDAIGEIAYKGWLVFELHGHNPAKDGSVKEVLQYNANYIRNWMKS